MAGEPSGILQSNWDGLNPNLIASFFPVEKYTAGEGQNKVTRWRRVPGSVEVRAPLTDGLAEVTANWQSPFEQSGADSRLPALSALLQVGGFEAVANAFMKALAQTVGIPLGVDPEASLRTLEGKTSVTKLNSTQVFTGMPPIRITCTAHFRALHEPDSEVLRPVDQLLSWALPKYLSSQGVIAGFVDPGTPLGIRTLYPSEVPQVLGMQYADSLFKPVVIESIPYPLTSPRDSKGRLISASLTMVIATLTALDRSDWAQVRQA